MKITLKFLELTSNYVQPVQDQHWSASAENRYHAQNMPVPQQHRKPVRDQHWQTSAEHRYHLRHMPVRAPVLSASTAPALASTGAVPRPL